MISQYTTAHDFFRRKYENLHIELTKNPSLEESVSEGSIFSPTKPKQESSLKKMASEEEDVFHSSSENIDRM